MACTDALLSACALCSLPSPARLALDNARPGGHGDTLSGLQPVPCDPHRRARREPGVPAALRPACQSVWRPLQRGQAREALGLWAGHDGVARDGTGYVSSTTMHGASGLHHGHRHGALP